MAKRLCSPVALDSASSDSLPSLPRSPVSPRIAASAAQLASSASKAYRQARSASAHYLRPISGSNGTRPPCRKSESGKRDTALHKQNERVTTARGYKLTGLHRAQSPPLSSAIADGKVMWVESHFVIDKQRNAAPEREEWRERKRRKRIFRIRTQGPVLRRENEPAIVWPQKDHKRTTWEASRPSGELIYRGEQKEMAAHRFSNETFRGRISIAASKTLILWESIFQGLLWDNDDNL